MFIHLSKNLVFITLERIKFFGLKKRKEFGCMIDWVRDPNNKRLNKLETSLDNSSELETESKEKEMGEGQP